MPQTRRGLGQGTGQIEAGGCPGHRGSGTCQAAASPGHQLALRRDAEQCQGTAARPDPATAIGSLAPKHPQCRAKTLNLYKK